jgi:hypothetical protein
LYRWLWETIEYWFSENIPRQTCPVMLGATTDENFVPIMAGASWNSSDAHGKMKGEDRILRQRMLGDDYYEYERATQTQIQESGSIEVWSEKMMVVRARIADPQWVVFRGRHPHQKENPAHIEPMCQA